VIPTNGFQKRHFYLPLIRSSAFAICSRWLPSYKALKLFGHPEAQLTPEEQLISTLGAAIGIGVAGWLCLLASSAFHFNPWLIAPLGASAVLLFVVPTSPFSEPWAIVGGNVVSAFSGILCVRLLHDPILGCAVAVGLAIWGMIQFRCIHPPGGGTALLCVLTRTGDWRFLLYPTMINAVTLVLVGVLFYLVLGRPYPKKTGTSVVAEEPVWHRYNRSDLEEVLKNYDQVVSTSVEDLEKLV